MSGLHLRRGEHRDAASLTAFNRAMARETETLELDDITVRAGVEGLLARPQYGFYLVAERDGALQGSLLITYEWSDWRNGVLWWIQSVYVIPEARRQGVFSTLFHEIHQQAQQAGSRGLRLYVEQDNHRAQATYRQLGMVENDYRLYEMLFSRPAAD